MTVENRLLGYYDLIVLIRLSSLLIHWLMIMLKICYDWVKGINTLIALFLGNMNENRICYNHLSKFTFPVNLRNLGTGNLKFLIKYPSKKRYKGRDTFLNLL